MKMIDDFFVHLGRFSDAIALAGVKWGGLVGATGLAIVLLLKLANKRLAAGRPLSANLMLAAVSLLLIATLAAAAWLIVDHEKSQPWSPHPEPRTIPIMTGDDAQNDCLKRSEPKRQPITPPVDSPKWVEDREYRNNCPATARLTYGDFNQFAIGLAAMFSIEAPAEIGIEGLDQAGHLTSLLWTLAMEDGVIVPRMLHKDEKYRSTPIPPTTTVKSENGGQNPLGSSIRSIVGNAKCDFDGQRFRVVFSLRATTPSGGVEVVGPDTITLTYDIPPRLRPVKARLLVNLKRTGWVVLHQNGFLRMIELFK